MNDKEYDIGTLAFLAQESKDLLSEQIKSYTDTHNKAGVAVSISAIYIPFILFFITNIESPSWLYILFSIPIISLLASIRLFLKILMPKKLHHGLNIEKIEEKLSKSHQEILLYEISANKKWIRKNEEIINPQQRNFKNGIHLIVISGIATFVLLLFSYSINVFNSFKSSELDKQIPVEQIDSQENNNQNSVKMKLELNDQNSDQEQNQETDSGQSEQTQETTELPYVPDNDSTIIERGLDSEPLIKK